jgi:hypothetical protein
MLFIPPGEPWLAATVLWNRCCACGRCWRALTATRSPTGKRYRVMATSPGLEGHLSMTDAMT